MLYTSLFHIGLDCKGGFLHQVKNSAIVQWYSFLTWPLIKLLLSLINFGPAEWWQPSLALVLFSFTFNSSIHTATKSQSTLELSKCIWALHNWDTHRLIFGPATTATLVRDLGSAFLGSPVIVSWMLGCSAAPLSSQWKSLGQKCFYDNAYQQIVVFKGTFCLCFQHCEELQKIFMSNKIST